MDTNRKYWPSPESLARKILVKGKKLPRLKSHKRAKRTALSNNAEEEFGEISDISCECKKNGFSAGDEVDGNEKKSEEEDKKSGDKQSDKDLRYLDEDSDDYNETNGLSYGINKGKSDEDNGNESEDEMSETEEEEVILRRDLNQDKHQTASQSVSFPVRTRRDVSSDGLSMNSSHHTLGKKLSVPVREKPEFNTEDSKKV